VPNELAKIPGGDAAWHRMGDVGYLDDEGRFWYCGRKSQRVETSDGILFTECVEAVFKQHPDVARCALVGIGSAGNATPTLVVEAATEPLACGETGMLSAAGRAAWANLVAELKALGARYEHTAGIRQFLLYPMLPVDMRHNAKINREALAAWATKLAGVGDDPAR
jgi:acyl-coenzyme A synthetase/AMP-(fatty) acid ligase